MTLVSPSLPLPRLPRTNLHVYNQFFPRVHLYLHLLPPLCPFVLYLPPARPPPPGAPVVTCRPPICLTGGRCHAAPICSVLMFDGLPPPTCTAGGTWLGCGWKGIGDAPPLMILRSSMRFCHTRQATTT